MEMEQREGRVREGKKQFVLRNSGQETGSWSRIHQRAAKEEALPGGRCVFCSGPHAAQDLRIWVGRPLALWVQGQSLGSNARNGHSAGCSVPNRGQGEGRMRTATAGSLTSKQLALNRRVHVQSPAEGPAHPIKGGSGTPWIPAPPRHKRDAWRAGEQESTNQPTPEHHDASATP